MPLRKLTKLKKGPLFPVLNFPFIPITAHTSSLICIQLAHNAYYKTDKAAEAEKKKKPISLLMGVKPQK
jgi:hypothetical protein